MSSSILSRCTCVTALLQVLFLFSTCGIVTSPVTTSQFYVGVFLPWLVGCSLYPSITKLSGSLLDLPILFALSFSFYLLQRTHSFPGQTIRAIFPLLNARDSYLFSNAISNIPSGIFTGLTTLQQLYGRASFVVLYRSSLDLSVPSRIPTRSLY